MIPRRKLQDMPIVKTKAFRLMSLALILLGSWQAGMASHIIGGEMFYRCLGNNQYEITLSIYRDCFYGADDAPFDDPAAIGIFDYQTNVLLQDLRVPFTGDDTLNSFLADPCFVVPPTVCVHTSTYRDTVELLPRPGGYYIAYQRCCRNVTINNIINPLRTGATYSIILTEEALNACNSSPVFTEWPPIFVCLGTTIDYDHSAVDAEGDSLVYKLCTPLAGASFGSPLPQPPNAPPYDTVRWYEPTFNLSNLLGSGDPLRINDGSGRLTGRPDLQGQFVVGVCVEEYRNGQLLSVTRRDFQYNVGLCGMITSAFQSPSAQCDNLTVDFDNQSPFSDSFEWIFDFPTGTLRSMEENPSFTFPDTGLYTVALIAEPNSVCADTAYQDVFLQDNSIVADFDVSVFDCKDSTQVVINDLSFDAVSPLVFWNWEVHFDNNIMSSSDQNPVFVVPSPDTIEVILTVRSQNGCEQVISRKVHIEDLDPGGAIPDTLRICEGSSVELNPNGDPSFTYSWTPATGLSDPNEVNPVATPVQTTTYTVDISAGNAFCNVTKHVTVEVQPTPQLDFDFEVDCDDRTVIFDNASISGQTDYGWLFGDPTDPGVGSGETHPSYTYPDTGTYTIKLFLGSSSTCQDTLVRDIRVEERTLDADFEIEYLNCEPGDITLALEDQSDFSSHTITEWDWEVLQTGATATGQSTQIILQSGQNVDITLVITTSQGCKDSLTRNLEINVVEDLPDDDMNICAGVATPLNPNANPNYLYEWSPAIYLDDPNAPNPIATVTQDQDFTVIIRALGADTCEVMRTVHVTIPDPINLQASPDMITCDSFATLRANTSGPASVIWMDGSTQVDTGRTIIVPVSGITTYRVIAEDMFGCTDEEEVRVAGGPVDADVSSDQSICRGAPFDISLTNLDPNDILTISWEPATGIISGANTANPVIDDIPGRRIFTVDVVNQFGCPFEDSVELIIVDPDMTLDFDYLVECSGLTVKFENQSTNAFDYVWHFGDPANPGATSNEVNPTYTYSGVGVYDVYLTIDHAIQGCTDTLFEQVELGDVVLDALFDASYDNCGEDAVDVLFSNNSFSLQNNIVSVQWDFGSYGTSTQNDTVVTLNSDGTITAQLIVEDAAGCIDSLTKTVEVELLELNLSDSLIMCENDSVFLNPNFNPDYNYQWSPAGLVDDPNSPNPKAHVTTTTTFTAIIQNISADTCEVMKTVKLVVPPLHNLEAPNDTISCGFPITLSASSSVVSGQFTWRNSQGAVVGNGSTATVNPGANGSEVYTVTVEDSYHCVSSDTFRVTNRQVDIETSGNKDACQAIYTQLNVTNQDPNDILTYQWSPPNRIISGGDSANPVVETDGTGTFFFLVYAENQYGCRDTGSVRLHVVEFAPAYDDQLEICAGEPTHINPVGNPNQQYQWTPADVLNMADIPDPVATLDTSTVFTVIITEQVDTLVCMDTVMVNVNVRPPIDLMTSEDITLCDPGTVELEASGGVPGLTYSWSDVPDFGNILVRDSVLITNKEGIYTYYVRAEDGLGCIGAGSVNVNIVPIEVEIDGDTTICVDVEEQIELINLHPEQILQYLWTPSEYITGPNDVANPSINAPQTTTFNVHITNQFDCEEDVAVTVNVVDLGFLVDVTATPDSILPGGVSQLLATFDGNYTYVWSPAFTLNNNQIHDPEARPNETTTYTVQVIDENGCIIEQTVRVTVFDPICRDPYVFLPSAFSPNNDNHNDQLRLMGDFVEEMTLEIYNRWGQKVFESTDQSEGWDGTFKGELMSPDVYGYYLRVKCINGEEFFKKGNVTLVR